MAGICGLLLFDVFERRIFAWRLIKMAMYANVFHQFDPVPAG